MSKPIPVPVQRTIMQAYALRDQQRLEEAKQLAEKVHKSYPTEKNTLYLLGSVHVEMKELDRAETYFKKGVNTDKNGHINQGGMGLTLLKKGDAKGATRWLKIALKRAPSEVSHLNNIALAYLMQGQVENAEKYFSAVLSVMPTHAEASLNLAELMRGKNRFDLAAAIYHRGLSAHPRDFSLLKSYADHLMLSNDSTKAEEIYERALELEPEHVEALSSYTEFLIQKGEIDKAADQIAKLLVLEPNNLFSISSLIKLKRAKTALEGELERVLEHCHQDILHGLKDETQKVMWHYYAADIEEHLGNFDLAFQCLDKANQITRTNLLAYGHRYERGILEDYVRQLEQFDGWDQLFSGNYGAGDDRPVFVVGMPRSGTTLTEQIIAAHPEGSGAGERNELWDIVRQLTPQAPGLSVDSGWIQALLNAGADTRKKLIDTYLMAYDREHGGKRRIVDKLPYNFLYVGFAAALFPKAHFIFCRRNKAAVGLSIYKQRFAAPYVFDTDLEEINHLYRIHDQLMALWHRVLPDRLHVLDYENLVSEPEGQARELINSLGLEWDDRCLEFYRSKRKVQTASMHQVRQPVYTASKDKYLKYADHLGPLLADSVDVA